MAQFSYATHQRVNLRRCTTDSTRQLIASHSIQHAIALFRLEQNVTYGALIGKPLTISSNLAISQITFRALISKIYDENNGKRDKSNHIKS